MPTTLSTALEDVRSRVNETSANFYTDSDLTNWINEGCKDIARRAQCLETMVSVNIFAGTKTILMPTNLYRLHRVDFTPLGSINTYPQEIRGINEMDSIWGINQNIVSYYPSYCFVYGAPPNMTITFFPVPSEPGITNIFYARVANSVINTTDVLDVPEGWSDAVVVYCEYIAKRKDGDDAWQAAYQDYKDKLTSLIENTATWHDQLGFITTGRQMIPSWVYGGSWWGW
jgi:hypothetical protein